MTDAVVSVGFVRMDRYATPKASVVHPVDAMEKNVVKMNSDVLAGHVVHLGNVSMEIVHVNQCVMAWNAEWTAAGETADAVPMISPAQTESVNQSMPAEAAPRALTVRAMGDVFVPQLTDAGIPSQTRKFPGKDTALTHTR